MTYQEMTPAELSEFTYAGFVSSKLKPGQDILASLTAEKCHVLHMLVGLAGESVELVNYEGNKNLLEEIGDVEFYLTGLELNTQLLTHQGGISKGDKIMDYHVPKYHTLAMYLHEIHECAHKALELGVKKWILYNKTIVEEQLKDEIRTIHRLLRGVYVHQKINRADILESNRAKLDKRYEKGYSDKAAQERADKIGEE